MLFYIWLGVGAFFIAWRVIALMNLIGKVKTGGE